MKKKDNYYFSHDSNARRDPKMIAILEEYGGAGYGWFWILIEVLREQEDYRIDITKKYTISSLASEMKSTPKPTEIFIQRCIEYDLIETDGIFIWSKSLNYRMEKYNETKKRYSDMASKRWSGKKSEVSKTEETAKEKKVNPKASVSILTNEFILELIKQDEFKDWSIAMAVTERNKAVDWLKSKGRVYKDYTAFFKNWLRNNKTGTTEDKSGKMVY